MTDSRCPLLVFGEDWGAHPSSTQHLIKHMNDCFDILWINSLGLRSPRITRHDIARLCKKALQMVRPDKANTGEPLPFPVKNVRAVPFYGSKWSQFINQKLIVNSLQAELSALDRAPLLWVSLPSALPVIGHMKESAVIYYCGDDFSQLAGVDHASIAKMEEQLVERAKVVLVASEKLADKYHRYGPILLPHGVDYELFSSPVPRAEDLPAHNRIAGFYGNIADWIDIEMMVEVARRLAHWLFVFVGPQSTDVSLLKRLPNVVFLGVRSHHELPRYSQHWQVSLLPFKQCGQINACNPLKLREYLAAGKPVVSVPFPAVDDFRSLVTVAEDIDAFCRAIESSAANDPRANLSRSESVFNDSWAMRANSVKSLINERINGV